MKFPVFSWRSGNWDRQRHVRRRGLNVDARGRGASHVIIDQSAISPRHEPQLVPALSASPTALTLRQPPAIEAAISLAPTP